MLRFEGLDSLMTANSVTTAKSFDAYWKEVMSKRESQDQNIEGFVYDTPEIDFTYEMLQAQAKIEVMASYVDYNSPALPAGQTVQMKKLTGSIPRMKYAVVRGENDYRKQLVALNKLLAVARFANKAETLAVREYVAKILFDTLDEINASFKNSLNYQVGQMKSRGALTLDDKNNPRGSIRTTFTAQVPTANFISKKYWEKASNGDLTPMGDPVTDIRDFVRELKWKVNGYPNVTIEMNEKFLYKLLAHPAVLKAIGYALSGYALRYSPKNDDNATAVGQNAGFEAQKEALQKLLEVDTIIASRTQCGVETFNTSTRRYERNLINAFDEDVILIRPTGTIGVIKNVQPLRPDGQAIYAMPFGGRALIEYIYNRDAREQRWIGEFTALAVPTRPDDMYYFTNLTQNAG